jgi:hypothetical protein
VIEQVIPSMLADLIGCYVIELDMIVRRTLGSELSVPLVITCVEITTACMRGDVIIVNIQAAISIWPVTIVE